MKNIEFTNLNKPAPACDEEIAIFTEKAGIGSLSPTFVAFCKQYNGGTPEESNNFFYPNQRMSGYWAVALGGIWLNALFGITGIEGFSIAHWSANTHRVWGLSEEFFCIASDGGGDQLVSRLLTEDDKVHLWAPNVEPHFIPIAETLAEFYEGLEQDRDLQED